MKKGILFLLIISMISCVPAAAEEIPIKLIVDNQMIRTDTVTVNDSTMVPLRALMESIDSQVKWEDATQEIDVIRQDKQVHLQIGNSVMQTPEGEVTLLAQPILHNGDTTYVPLRAICEAFGLTVDWDEGTKTILVLSPDGCPYVDFYDGMTAGEYWIASGGTPDNFEVHLGVSYEENKDQLYAKVVNAQPLHSVAAVNNMSVEEVRELLCVSAETPDTVTWGEMLGELSMEKFISLFTYAEAIGMSPEVAMESLRNTYDLGSEYTLETKYKYVRTVMDLKEIQKNEEEKRKEEEWERQKAADLEALPSLCENKIYFTITMENGGVMKGELYPDVAPITVANFVELCDNKYYDGLIFHRVIDDFMIQGGGYNSVFEKKNTAPIQGEFYQNGISNALRHERGVLSMARTDDLNSASGEFFIVDEEAPHLDGFYAAFGRITSGFEVLDAIAQTETTINDLGYSNVPVKPIVIKSVRIEK